MKKGIDLGTTYCVLSDVTKGEREDKSEAIFLSLSVPTVAGGIEQPSHWVGCGKQLDVKLPPTFTYIYEFDLLHMDALSFRTVCTICRQSSQLGRRY